jgi:hypothetical protein
MTSGEQVEGAIPAVPKGFVRLVQLRRINDLSAHSTSKMPQRDVYYFYFGKGRTVPDTAGWEPFGEQIAAAMADKRASSRIYVPHHAAHVLSPKLSVQRILEENPVLVSAGVTLEDFSFTVKGLSRNQSQPSQLPAPAQPITSDEASCVDHMEAEEPPTAATARNEPSPLRQHAAVPPTPLAQHTSTVNSTAAAAAAKRSLLTSPVHTVSTTAALAGSTGETLRHQFEVNPWGGWRAVEAHQLFTHTHETVTRPPPLSNECVHVHCVQRVAR